MGYVLQQQLVNIEDMLACIMKLSRLMCTGVAKFEICRVGMGLKGLCQVRNDSGIDEKLLLILPWFHVCLKSCIRTSKIDANLACPKCSRAYDLPAERFEVLQQENETILQHRLN